ncbi:MAG: metallophosphoesterase [Desulfobacterales bacterium]|nr:metallophosphoesterase [Desulfobacterales bacterium]
MQLPSKNFRERHRLVWETTRAMLEADNFKHRKYGEKRKPRWSLFETLIQVFYRGLKLTPLYPIGVRNAKTIVVYEHSLYFKNLPHAFNGYTLLHLTDLHLDMIPETAQTICRRIAGLEVDGCVLTGDYCNKIGGEFKNILQPMRQVVSGIRARDGIFATLGNHDSYRMTPYFEQMGIRMLNNETVSISRGQDRIWLTGLDDPYYYFTDQAIHTLEQAPAGFKIVLVHAPSLFDMASASGYHLYLCGHTHGGQICLPGGIPIIRHLRYGRQYYRGMWQHGRMTGYTGQGTGTVGIPIRFNTQSEITLFRLYRQ